MPKLKKLPKTDESPAPVKKKPKKIVRRKLDSIKQTKNHFLFKKVQEVPIGSLKPHPKNPNVGDVDSIAESLAENGMFKPIVVNKRNGYIVGGHHTWLAARQLGWTKIGVVEIDVDDTKHLRMMLADNATADRRTYDEKLLNDILQSLGDVTGTGYTELDVADLDERVSSMASDALSSLENRRQLEKEADDELKLSKTFDGAPLGEEPDPDSPEAEYAAEEDDDEDPNAPDPIQDADEELSGGLIQFKPPANLAFPGVGKLEIPELRTDMLMKFNEIPENLQAWAGSATKDWPDEDQWWLYNWGIDSTSGMRDVSKVIISFYCFDDYFDNWWWYPERYMGKVVNSGIKYMVTPDWSMETKQSRAFSIWQLYRNRWMARYFQECGIKVIPNICWKDGDEFFLKQYVLGTLPVGMPCIAIQMQTIDPENVEGGMETYKRHLQLVFDTLKPKGVLFYVGKQAPAIIQELNLKGIKVMMVESRMGKLAEKAKQRTKKRTI